MLLNLRFRKHDTSKYFFSRFFYTQHSEKESTIQIYLEDGAEEKREKVQEKNYSRHQDRRTLSLPRPSAHTNSRLFRRFNVT